MDLDELLDVDRWSTLPEKLPGAETTNPLQEVSGGTKISDIAVGQGRAVAAENEYVRVDAKAFLVDGEPIYASREVGGTEDLPTTLFPGWKAGLQGMKIGGRRKIIIPWDQTFVRNEPQRSLPAGATLIFDVHLIEIDPWSQRPDPMPGWHVKSGPVTTESGLSYYDIDVGEGDAPASPQDKVRVHYTGYLVDGTSFDSSYERQAPIDFVLSNVIPGWTEGVGSMKPGGKRKLIIPADLAYGDRGSPPAIPPSALLIFDVELLEVNPTQPPPPHYH